MATQDNCNAKLCERLKKLGFEQRKRIRMYGEEFDLTSNPIQNGSGFSVEVINTNSGSARRLPIPRSILRMVEKDVDASTRRKVA